MTPTVVLFSFSFFTQGPEKFKPMITGYETTPGTTKYERGAEEKLASSAVAQLKKLFEMRRQEKPK
jgi:hypothetical protein